MKNPYERYEPNYSPGPIFADPSALVHPIETSEREEALPASQPCPPAAPPIFHSSDGSYRFDFATPAETAFRHSGWSNQRTTMTAAIASRWQGTARLHAFTNCGSAAEVWARKADGSLLILAHYCHDRFCWPCAKSRSSLIGHNLRQHLSTHSHRFITLSLKSSDQPITWQIDKLYRCFKLLRRDSWWQRHTTGGAAFFEATLNDLSLQWHPHLHIIVEGGYVPHAMLSRKWLGVTGDSYIVHIEAIPDNEATLRYVTKYGSKSIDGSVFFNLSKLNELVTALSGRRLCATFGRWQGLKLTQRTNVFDATQCVRVGWLANLIIDAAAGDHWSASILNLLKRNATWNPRPTSPSTSPPV